MLLLKVQKFMPTRNSRMIFLYRRASSALHNSGLSPTALWWYRLNSLLVSPLQRSCRWPKFLLTRYCCVSDSHHCDEPSWNIRKSFECFVSVWVFVLSIEACSMRSVTQHHLIHFFLNLRVQSFSYLSRYPAPNLSQLPLNNFTLSSSASILILHSLTPKTNLPV